MGEKKKKSKLGNALGANLKQDNHIFSYLVRSRIQFFRVLHLLWVGDNLPFKVLKKKIKINIKINPNLDM